MCGDAVRLSAVPMSSPRGTIITTELTLTYCCHQSSAINVVDLCAFSTSFLQGPILCRGKGAGMKGRTKEGEKGKEKEKEINGETLTELFYDSLVRGPFSPFSGSFLRGNSHPFRLLKLFNHYNYP